MLVVGLGEGEEGVFACHSDFDAAFRRLLGDFGDLGGQHIVVARNAADDCECVAEFIGCCHAYISASEHPVFSIYHHH